MKRGKSKAKPTVSLAPITLSLPPLYPVEEIASTSIAQPVSMSISTPISQPVSMSISTPISQPVSMSISTPISQPASTHISQPLSLPPLTELPPLNLLREPSAPLVVVSHLAKEVRENREKEFKEIEKDVEKTEEKQGTLGPTSHGNITLGELPPLSSLSLPPLVSSPVSISTPSKTKGRKTKEKKEAITSTMQSVPISLAPLQSTTLDLPPLSEIKISSPTLTREIVIQKPEAGTVTITQKSPKEVEIKEVDREAEVEVKEKIKEREDGSIEIKKKTKEVIPRPPVVSTLPPIVSGELPKIPLTPSALSTPSVSSLPSQSIQNKAALEIAREGVKTAKLAEPEALFQLATIASPANLPSRPSKETTPRVRIPNIYEKAVKKTPKKSAPVFNEESTIIPPIPITSPAAIKIPRQEKTEENEELIKNINAIDVTKLTAERGKNAGYSVNELKSLAGSLGLTKNGSKKDLVERIKTLILKYKPNAFD